MTAETSSGRKALTVIVVVAALFVAVVLQLSVVNRLPLPAGTAPDLVLLLVAAVAVVTTPGLAAVTGFAGGLAVDIAPPAAHYTGEYALVFCLVSYAAARIYRATMNTTGDHDPVTAFTIMAAATAAGEAGKVALGLLLSNPDMTPAVVSRALPGAILYNLVLSPLAFWLVARLSGGAVLGHAARAATAEFSGDQRLAPEVREAGFGEAAFRQAATGAAPGLQLAGTGMNFGPKPPPHRVPRLRLAGTGTDYSVQPVTGRVPKLRLADARATSIPATAAGSSGTARSPLPSGQRRKLNFAGDLPARAAGRAPGRAARTPGKNWLRPAASPGLAGLGRRTAYVPARGWLGAPGVGGIITGPGGHGARPHRSALAGARIGRRMGDVVNGRAARVPQFAGGRSSAGRAHPRHFSSGTLGTARPGAFPAAPQRPRSADEALAARSAPSGLSALAGTGTSLASRRAPQPGWLGGRGSASRPAVRKSPRTGWLGRGHSRRRTVIGSAVSGHTVITGGAGLHRGAFRRRRPAVTRNWYTSSPSSTWLRRGRNPWRKRSQRLLRMMRLGK